MRLIDKEALIEAIGEEPEVWMPDDYAQGLHDQWAWDLEAINSMPEINAWNRVARLVSTGIRAVRAEDPMSAVASGTGAYIEFMTAFEKRE